MQYLLVSLRLSARRHPDVAARGHMKWCVSVYSSQSRIIIPEIIPLVFFPPDPIFYFYFLYLCRASSIFPDRRMEWVKRWWWWWGGVYWHRNFSILFSKIMFFSSPRTRTPAKLSPRTYIFFFFFSVINRACAFWNNAFERKHVSVTSCV